MNLVAGQRSFRKGLAFSTLLAMASFVQASSFITPPSRRSNLNHGTAIQRPTAFTMTGPPRTGTTHLQTLFPPRGGSSSTALQMTSFDNTPFWKFNLIICAANLLGFLISVVSGGSHLHLDLLGTGAFALAALPTGGLLDSASTIPRIQLSAGCVTLWGTKLALFLFWRALQLKHDGRLTDVLSTVSGTASFWVVSLMWGVLASLPHSMGATSSANVPILQSPCGVAGAALFVLGILTETTADIQKWIFKKNNPGQFCNVGLWSISQHPNFFGNMMLWSGIFLLNAPALIADPPASAASEGAGTITNILQHIWRFRRVAVAALSPLFLYTLFSGQASGTITNAKELAMKRYGSDPSFQAYIQNVPLIFPNPLKILIGPKNN